MGTGWHPNCTRGLSTSRVRTGWRRSRSQRASENLTIWVSAAQAQYETAPFDCSGTSPKAVREERVAPMMPPPTAQAPTEVARPKPSPRDYGGAGEALSPARNRNCERLRHCLA
jgi:hypothetical protein